MGRIRRQGDPSGRARLTPEPRWLSRWSRLLVAVALAAVLGLAACASGDDADAEYVVIETEFGDMRVMLYNSTPQHRDNFLELAGEGFYDGLLWHRVIKGFIVQGGDPNSRGAAPDAFLGEGGLDYRIPAEIGAPHFRGTLAAARQPDEVNPDRSSNAAQFYLVQGGPEPDDMLDLIERANGIRYSAAQRELYRTLGGTPELDGKYTVFGEVVDGIEVIDSIANRPTSQTERPLRDIEMRVRLD